jgi:hypothetical protein
MTTQIRVWAEANVNAVVEAVDHLADLECVGSFPNFYEFTGA